MTINDIKALIGSGESQTLELKNSATIKGPHESYPFNLKILIILSCFHAYFQKVFLNFEE